MVKHIINQKGSSMIGAVIVMALLAVSAATITFMSSSDSVSTADNVNLVKARAIGNAGLQRAMNILNYGGSPDSVDVPFGNSGSFTTTTDPTQSAVTVVSTVGKAKVTQSINLDFSRNCVDLIVDDAYTESNTLHDVKFNKTCNQQAILAKLYYTWNWSSCAINTNCDGTISNNETVYEETGDPPGNNKFWICHVPPGNPENKQTLAVNQNGWENGHDGGSGPYHCLDYLGPCIISGGDPIDTCESTAASETALNSCTTSDGSATVTQVDLASTTIFQSGSIPDANAAATSSGEVTDVANAVMTSNGNYVLDTLFSTVIPEGAWMTITAEFADGSTLTETFKVGSGDNGNNGNNGGDDDDDDGDDVNEDPDGFDVEDGVVTIEAGYQVDLDAIGSAITCGEDGPEVNVQAQLCINNNCSNLWNNHDIDGGETYSTTNDQANSDYKIIAHAYLNSCGHFSRTVDSTNTIQVKTLVDGEQAPPLAGFGGQKSVQDFLANYLNENGIVTINDDQVIMLFELGVDLSTNPTSTAADFQDLVLLMTIQELTQ